MKIPRQATFSPTHVSKTFRWCCTWQRAASNAGLPGSSVRVLQVLLGMAGRGRRTLSRKSISRLGGIPLSTVRNGVDQLLAAGWVLQATGGVRLVLEASAGAVFPEGRGGRKSPPRKELLEEEKRVNPIPQPATPPGAVVPLGELSGEQRAVADLLEQAGANPAGAQVAAKRNSLPVEGVRALLQDLAILARERKIQSVPKMAVWAIKGGKRAARQVQRQAARHRGKQARAMATAPAEAFRPKDSTEKNFRARCQFRALSLGQRRELAAEFREEMENIQGQTRRLALVGVLLQDHFGISVV